MKIIKISSLVETEAIAKILASKLFPGTLITMTGDLGAGKTTFTKFLGKAIGIVKTINSPTFNILKIYDGDLRLYHIDAYRLEGIQQDLGFEEVFEDDGICIVEWPQFIEYALPKDRLEITITNGPGEQRIFSFNGIGTRYKNMEDQL